MVTCARASGRGFRRPPGRRPRTFWHCPKGSWTSKRLAFLCTVRGACRRVARGFRWAPVTPRAAPRGAASRLICSPSVWSDRAYRVWDEMRMRCSPHSFTKQDQGAGDLGAARLGLWALSPLSYLSAPPAHPVEPRARRGKCRRALSARRTDGLVDQSSHALATSGRAAPLDLAVTREVSHV